MNNEKHLRELLQAALDGKPLQCNVTGGGWFDCIEHPIMIRIAKIFEYGASSYRIKLEVKTFTYQTRIYMVNETICVWCCNSGRGEQREKEMYAEAGNFKWLAPAQTHTIEYTE
jgi:hypothetical protein